MGLSDLRSWELRATVARFQSRNQTYIKKTSCPSIIEIAVAKHIEKASCLLYS